MEKALRCVGSIHFWRKLPEWHMICSERARRRQAWRRGRCIGQLCENWLLDRRACRIGVEPKKWSYFCECVEC